MGPKVAKRLRGGLEYSIFLFFFCAGAGCYLLHCLISIDIGIEASWERQTSSDCFHVKSLSGVT